MENIKQKKKKKSSKEKIEENRKKIVDRLISNMEKGYIFSEWAWNRKAFLPRNAITGTPYQGINRLNLSFEAIERNYNDPRWLTLRKDISFFHIRNWVYYKIRSKRSVL